MSKLNKILAALCAIGLAAVAGLSMCSPARAQLGPSTPGPMYAPNWYQGYVPTPYQWTLMWSNKIDYYPAGLPISFGGTGATTQAQARTNLGITGVSASVVPGTTTITGAGAHSNGLLWNTGGVLGNLVSANSGVLVTSAGGVPSISSTLPTGLAMGTPASIVLTNATGLPAAALTGTTLPSSIITSSLTTVGTLVGGGTGAGFTVALATSTLTGALPAANMPALTGDVTSSAGAVATTLATVASAGTTGSSTAIPVITIDVKGRTTGISTAAVIAPAGTLTGATLASNVLASSLTSTGTLTGGATGAGFTVALGSSTITGRLSYANFVQGATNTVPANATSGTADFAAFSMPSCSGASSALIWTTNTGFGCNSITPGTGTVTSVSVATANGVSGTVATATSTPAITLVLGAITPSTVNGNTITTGTGTLTLGAGKTATISNTLAFTGTDSTSFAFPSSSDTVVTLTATQTLTNKTLTTAALGSSTATTQAASDNSTKVATTAYAASVFSAPQGRLTLTSATPVLTSTVSGATTIYYAYYQGNQVPIYNGTTFLMTTLVSELSNVTTASSVGSAGPAAVTTNSNYDLFVWSNSGTPTLTRGPLWTSNTGRGTGAGTTELQRISGIYTNKVAITNGPGANLGTYVGTVRSNGSSQIDWIIGSTAAGGGAAFLNVWNAYNRVSVRGLVIDSTASWTYSTASYRSADNSTANRVSFVYGLQEDEIDASYYSAASDNVGSASMTVAIGFNSVTVPSGRTGIQGVSTAVANNFGGSVGAYAAQPIGFNYMQALEFANTAGAMTWNVVSGVSALVYNGRF